MNKNYKVAKFMGFIPEEFEARSKNGLKYNISWDWLMPVIAKIKTIVMEDDTDELYNSEQWDNITHTLVQIDIESVFIAVVEFIDWYES